MTETRRLQLIVAALVAGAAVIASLPAHAAPISPALIKTAVDCMHKLTGLDIPATLPSVEAHDEWYFDGRRQVVGRYYPAARHIDLYAARDDGTLVHELTHHAFQQQHGDGRYAESEDMAHEAGWLAREECPE